MPLATVNDTKIFYEVTGDGPPLVLITGQGIGPEGRAPLIRALAGRHAVLTYDQRGSGRSERVPEGVPIQTLAADVLGLMDAAGFDRAHVLGHSTGTGMASVLAADHPDRVESLLLACPWTHADAHLTAIQELRKTAARTLPADQYANFNALLLYPPEYRRAHADLFADLAARALDNPHDPDSIAARLDAILAFDARPYYPRIACPTVVLTTPDDQVMPRWFAEEAAGAIPGARLVILDGGGHMVTETRMEEVVGVEFELG
jgi:aminoacrylate hydrolase